MYYFEWVCWRAKLEPEASRKNDPALGKLHELDDLKDQAFAKISVSQTPKSRGPVYIFDDRILEMRCGIWESRRGFITILTTGLIAIFCKISVGVGLIIIELFHALPGNVGALDTGLVLMLFFYIAVISTALWVYFKYCWDFSRLEIFTSRHLLIRFNRKTHQVHLHRPPHCGGIVTLPWEGVISTGADLKAAEVSAFEVPLMLTWPSPLTGTLQAELACVGKPSLLQSDIRDEWEFIRRFMDEGAHGLPRPHITSHFPWPWQAFTPPFEGLEKYFHGSSIKVKIGLLLISPAALLFGVGHWLSLMLCWKPRWPKVIRQAGLPGKPVPAQTSLADYPLPIQQRLQENAYLWAVHPASPPENRVKQRARRKNHSVTRP